MYTVGPCGCDSENLRALNVRVYVGDSVTDTYTYCGTILEAECGEWTTIDCGVKGDSIRLERPAGTGVPDQVLHFCGVKAYGYKPEESLESQGVSYTYARYKVAVCGVAFSLREPEDSLKSIGLNEDSVASIDFSDLLILESDPACSPDAHGSVAALALAFEIQDQDGEPYSEATHVWLGVGGAEVNVDRSWSGEYYLQVKAWVADYASSVEPVLIPLYLRSCGAESIAVDGGDEPIEISVHIDDDDPLWEYELSL